MSELDSNPAPIFHVSRESFMVGRKKYFMHFIFQNWIRWFCLNFSRGFISFRFVSLQLLFQPFHLNLTVFRSMSELKLQRAIKSSCVNILWWTSTIVEVKDVLVNKLFSQTHKFNQLSNKCLLMKYKSIKSVTMSFDCLDFDWLLNFFIPRGTGGITRAPVPANVGLGCPELDLVLSVLNL